MKAQTEALEAVLQLAARGWRLLPCAVKVPLIRDWPTRASCDAEVICEWDRENEGCNWGALCGQSFWVIDIDGTAGDVSLRALIEEHGDDWTATLTATTGRGTHLYFACSNGHRIQTGTGKLGFGVDIRGAGSYAIVPPSLHPSGVRYEWIDPKKPIAEPPHWLIDLVAENRPTMRRKIGILLEGQRNDGLTRLAGAMRRRGSEALEIETALLAANSERCATPLPEHEVRAIALSVARYPVGGPDPLESAWHATEAQTYSSRYERFLALAIQLQLARPGQPVALPVERIGQLMKCDWSQVKRYRKRAVMESLLRLVAPAVPHRRAAQYRVAVPLGVSCPTNKPISGLVGHSNESPLVGHTQEAPSGTPKKSPSGTAPNDVEEFAMGNYHANA
jgi:hypothetical protein